MDPAVRFWMKVDKSPRPDGCWIWTGARIEYGYGVIWVNGKNVRSTKFSLSLVGVVVPDGLFVCHRCDNPPCVNPTHLFVGTHADNMADKVAKGRQSRTGPRKPARGRETGAYTHPEMVRRGNNHGQSILTEEEAGWIIAMLSVGGRTHRRIADLVGTNHNNVKSISRRKNWRWLWDQMAAV